MSSYQPGPPGSWAHKKSEGRREFTRLLPQTCTTACIRSAKCPPRCCLATGQRPLLPVVLTPGPCSTEKGQKEGAALRTRSPRAPGRQRCELISILPAKPASQQLPANRRGTEPKPSTPAPSDLRLCNREREAVQLVLVASDPLARPWCVCEPPPDSRPGSEHPASRGGSDSRTWNGLRANSVVLVSSHAWPHSDHPQTAQPRGCGDQQ